jgi:hypothetical protein
LKVVEKMSLNWASKACGAKIVDFSSEVEGCEAMNVVDPQLSNIWLTDEKSPQWLCLSLNGNFEGQKTTIRALGWHCWHAYTTNPKTVRKITS